MENNALESYIMTFFTTTHTMQAYAVLKERMDVTIMPVPREISASCGLAIKLHGDDKKAFCDYFNRLHVPARLFCLEGESGGQDRHVALISEHQGNQAEA